MGGEAHVGAFLQADRFLQERERFIRTWGDVPQENVIGKCWFVYWPFTERFGWGTR